jgi:anaerobic magnesium-protoporphyrin IX monomethyl ester cyclase
MNIALVNPPGKYRYLRDYYCASIAKSDYYYPPIDLVWLSAALEEPFWVFDAIAENLSVSILLKELEVHQPEVIFCLISGISLEEDLQFIRSLKERLKAKIIVLGDICRVAADKLLSSCPQIDVVLKSFAVGNIREVLNNLTFTTNLVPGWAWAYEGRIVQQDEPAGPGPLRIGVPKWDKFSLGLYRFPFAQSQPVATVLTDYGCPFKCSFCPVGTLEWQLRDLEEVFKEINLISNLGIREIHFRDQTFGVDKKRTFSLLNYLAGKKIGWSCFSRIDVVNEELLQKMRGAGCHTVIFGIESGDYGLRKKYGKDMDEGLLLKTLRLCAKSKLNTVGTFIIGLPGDDKEGALKTIQLARKLPLDYASFNVAMPRFGSELRQALEESSIPQAGGNIIDNSERLGFMDAEEALQLASLANRRFYLRFSYLLKRLGKIRSFSAFLDDIKIGHRLIWR